MDDHVVLRNVSWTLFEQILQAKGEDAMPRIAYLDGTLELKTSSAEHERIVVMISRLLEGYAAERGLDINSFLRWTLRSQEMARGVEADDCYFIGARKGFPDLAIEVDWSRTTIDKLEIYRGLGVREVWHWHRGRVEVHVLERGTYHRSPTSALFRDLDLRLLASFVGAESQLAAVEAFRAAIRTADVTPRTRPRRRSPRTRASRRGR
jgi:Uma2 family endonuclease